MMDKVLGGQNWEAIVLRKNTVQNNILKLGSVQYIIGIIPFPSVIGTYFGEEGKVFKGSFYGFNYLSTFHSVTSDISHLLQISPSAQFTSPTYINKSLVNNCIAYIKRLATV